MSNHRYIHIVRRGGDILLCTTRAAIAQRAMQTMRDQYLPDLPHDDQRWQDEWDSWHCDRHPIVTTSEVEIDIL